MAKNLKNPDTIIIYPDGTEEKIFNDKDIDEFEGWNQDDTKKEVIYNNVYGMNPAFGSSPYDIEDVTKTAVRYTEVIQKAMQHGNE